MALLVWIVASTCAVAEDAVTSAARLIDSDRVLVIAHRGDSRVAPENTLPAFASAIGAGADLIELDYHHSSDGIPVVLHDNDLARTSDAKERWGNGAAFVGSKTLGELRELDAGSWFGSRFAGTRIPTLDEALTTIQAGSATLIERKAGDATTCIKLLEKKDLVGRVVVQSFNWDYVAECHKIAPRLALGALGGRELNDEKLDRIQKIGADVVVWQKDSLDRDAIAAVHNRGLRVWSWTVDDMKRAGQLIDDGIDGIITDLPATVKGLLDQRAAAKEDEPALGQ